MSLEKVFNSKYIVKTGSNFIAFDVNNEINKFNKKSHNGIILRASDFEDKAFVEIELGKEWIFLFSEIIDLYNKLGEINFYSHQWIFGNYILRITHFKDENVLFMFKHKNSENTLNVIFEPTSYFELICKMIEVIQNIKNFRFSLINQENEKENLSIAKIDDKQGTIITTYKGVEFGKPHLFESDKYQIKYSAIHRILFGRWLTVNTERVNISVLGVITTVDSEYILDKNEQNKSSLVALVLLASLSFKEI
ncbi:hypothetical protein ACOTWR_06300 [Aliarcobacter butzleri]|uniref:hypothetical protein n=1 Tax=Aliarcobacter butzleri TaxID=28197 RepID=UPI0021B45FCD|nr:hypothetical protein [Aliarcobacter butzleri]MCT7563187.1 hypothetical protein [Aliarcobacter butzleri]MCT7578662.1 hypothetical protein [Aliarcobacter butzleri]MCT7647604.1 hypothetical protein [Aliarcobacter butzleri]